jgi:hypothetical protein
MKSRTSVVSIASIVVSLFFSIGLASIPAAYAVTPSGQVNYFNVSGGVCTSTAWTGATAVDGKVPYMFPNNLGGPPNTAVVGTGSICVQVVLTDAKPNTVYTITGTKLSGTLTITTDSSGNGSGEAVFTSTFSGACTTNVLKMSPSTPFTLIAGQINHGWVGTGCGTTTSTTTTSTTTTSTTTTSTTTTSTTTTSTTTTSTTTTHGVPEFPAGFVVLLALIVPALLLLRKRASLYA